MCLASPQAALARRLPLAAISGYNPHWSNTVTVLCLKCKARLAVPDDRAGNPRLKLKCPGCGLVFPLAKAPRERAVRRPQRRPAATPEAGTVGGAAAAPAQDAASTRMMPAAEPAPPEPVAGPPDNASETSGSQSLRSISQLPLPPDPEAGDGADWRRCVVHPEVASHRVCPRCFRSFCPQCGRQIQRAVLCDACDEVICVPTPDFEAKLARARRMQRSMGEELGTVLRFPLTEPATLVALTVVFTVFFFTENLGLGFTTIIGWILGRGILMGYTFHQLEQVSDGERSLTTPPISDVWDIVGKALLGGAAMLVSWGPALYALFGLGGSVLSLMQHGPEASGSLLSLVVHLGLLMLGLAWLLAYFPAAMIVAAHSHSILETLKPNTGIATIRRMGRTYWAAFAITSGLLLAQFLVTVAFSFIPILGLIVAAAAKTYVFLAIGCALGLAVDKKAEELGLT